MSPAPLPLAVSLGDPAGIGPEIICAAYLLAKASGGAHPFAVIGGESILREASRATGIDCPVTPIDSLSQAAGAFASGLPVLPGPAVSYRPAQSDAEGARAALASLETATRLALSGEASAVVTAPVAKSALAAVGFDHPGQTEYFAHASGMGAGDAVMMLAGPSLRAVPLTVHVALAQVPGLLSPELIVHKGKIVANALTRDFGIEHPRLAVAGLNPHAGEGGQFGDEEARLIEPAIAALREAGIAVVGPVPGDALFTPVMRGSYDAALCMYHDQALIPVKALDFDRGVNVTLGLPIVRTSPDHGTAFDIAGTGKADPGAMVAALEMASACARARAKARD